MSEEVCFASLNSLHGNKKNEKGLEVMYNYVHSVTFVYVH